MFLSISPSWKACEHVSNAVQQSVTEMIIIVNFFNVESATCVDINSGTDFQQVHQLELMDGGDCMSEGFIT